MSIRAAHEALITLGRHRLRVLTINSQPWAEDSPLDLRGEWTGLVNAARAGNLPLTLVRLRPPTIQRLRDTIALSAAQGAGPHVVHFAGHGDVDHLLFEDDLGARSAQTRPEVYAALKPWGDRLEARVQVALLNACHSATAHTKGFARGLVEQGIVRVAIGYRQPIVDEAAVEFARVLYGALARGDTVLTAYMTARESLRVPHPQAWADVVLEGDADFALSVRSVAREARVADGLPQPSSIPEAARFFGRSAEGVELGQWLADPNTKGIAVAGIGGIGKSTVCRAVARRHAWRFAGGVVEVTARGNLYGMPTALDLLLEAAAELGMRERHDTPQQTIRRLSVQAAEAPFLVHFDNLETLPENELRQLLQFVDRLPLGGAKALLSLRPNAGVLHECADLRVLTLVRGLSRRPAAGYALRLAQGKSPPVDALTNHADPANPERGLAGQIAQATGGHPKMIEVAVGVLHQHGLPELGIALPEASQIADTLTAEALARTRDHVFASSFNLLSAEGRAVLSLLPIFPTTRMTDAEGEAAIAALDAARDWTVGVANCVAAGLLAREDGLLCHHSTIAQLAARLLPLAEAARDRVMLALLGQALQYSIENDEEFSKIRMRHAHLFCLFEAAWLSAEGEEDGGAAQLRSDLLKVADGLSYYLLQMGEWTLMQRWRERLRAAPSADQASLGHQAYKASLLAFNRGDYSEARRLLAESMAIDEALGDRRGIAVAQNQLAHIEHAQGDLVEARRLLGLSMQTSRALDDRGGLAASQHHLASIEYAQGNHARARQLLGECIEIFEALQDPHGRAASQHELAQVEQALGNFTEAERLVKESIAADADRGDRKGQAGSLRLHAHIVYAQGGFVEARRILGAAIGLQEALDDQEGRAASLHQLAQIEHAQGHFGEARRRVTESIAAAKAAGNRQGQSGSIHLLARIEYAQGNHAEARRLLAESIALDETLGNLAGRAASLHQLAQVESAQGALPEARRWLSESIAAFEALKDQRGLAASLHELAQIEHRQGQVDLARQLLSRSMALKAAIGDQKGHAASLHQLASIEFTQGNLGEARRLLTESIAASEEMGDRLGCAASQHQLAVIEYTEGKLTEARHLLTDSLATNAVLGNRQGCATSQHQLAVIEYAQGNLGEARRLLTESIAANEALGNPQGYAASLHELARMQNAEGESGEARRLLTEAISILEGLGDRAGRAASLHQLAIIEYAQGDHREARRLLGDAIATHDAVGDRQHRAASQTMLGQIRFAHDDQTAGLALVEDAARQLREIGDGRADQVDAIAETLRATMRDTAEEEPASDWAARFASTLSAGDDFAALGILEDALALATDDEDKLLLAELIEEMQYVHTLEEDS